MRGPVATLASLLAAGGLAVFASGCAGGAAAGSAAEAAAQPDGASLYRRNCASCHRLKSPTEQDAATWRRAVERFGARLPAGERAAIADYLAAASGPAGR